MIHRFVSILARERGRCLTFTPATIPSPGNGGKQLACVHVRERKQHTGWRSSKNFPKASQVITSCFPPPPVSASLASPLPPFLSPLHTQRRRSCRPHWFCVFHLQPRRQQEATRRHPSWTLKQTDEEDVKLHLLLKTCTTDKKTSEKVKH